MPVLLSALSGDAEIEALLSDERLLVAVLRVEGALAAAEAEAALIDPAAATAIAAGIARYEPDWRDLTAGMRRDGVIVPALVRQLRACIGDPHAGDLHRGATSQDIIDTALSLQLASIVPILLARIAGLEEELASLENRFGSGTMMAHTRMQAALPFRVADKLRGWSEPLQRHRAALEAMLPDLLVVQLGGPVGDRSSFDGRGDAIAEALAARLGLGAAPSWHTSRDRIVGFGSRLAMLAGSLGKFGFDVALMAQTEIGDVSLAGAGGSSAMPHKANPVAAELLVALAHYAAGLAGTLQNAMVHENERSGAAWTLEWLTVPPLVLATGASLSMAGRLLSQLRLR